MRKFVPGEGPKNARVMIIGQNPAREEEKQGRPFVGAAGKFLNKILEKKKPKIILLLGELARKYTPRKKGIRYIETYHPVAAMMFEKYRKAFEREFKNLKKII
jgi:uracil-DNA glycosylase